MRRRNKSTREKESLTISGAKALAAGAAIAAGTQAYAAPIRFDNPAHDDTGHFHWLGDWLDVTSDADGQNTMGGVSFLQSAYRDNYGIAYSFVENTTGLGEVDTTTYDWQGAPFSFLKALGSNEFIPRLNALFEDRALISGYYPGPYSPFIEGANAYVGVRINLGSQWHYGWIGVRRVGEYLWNSELEAFAWGYETEAGVPIAAGAVPEPGTLAMLALGFVGAGAATRRPTRRHLEEDRS